MCGLAAFSIGTQIGGAVMGGVGKIMAGRSQAAMHNYNAMIADRNQKVAEWQAEDAIKRGRIEANRVKLEAKHVRGKQKAAFAANNISVTSGGTVADMLDDTDMYGEIDAMTIMSNAERQAYGYRVQASNYEAQAHMGRASAKSARRAGVIGAFSDFLGGASSVAKNWYAFNAGRKKTTIFGNTKK